MAARNALLLAFVLSLAAGEALAQARPLSTRMSCRQAAGLVHARGALVLGTGLHTYDRYVRDRSFCEITEIVEPAFAPTLDTPQCFVGYTCKEPMGLLWDID
jgi:hypothetical protein